MIDFWNRRLVKSQRERIEWLESVVNMLRQEIEKNEKMMMGERVITGYCERCIHGIRTESHNYRLVCELECRCKDYEKKLP